MKADVHPARNALPQLDIPSWVPDAIAQHVSAKYAADVAWIYRETFRESGYFGLDDFGFDRADKLPDEYLDALLRDDVALREGIADLARDDLADTTGRYLPLVCDRRMKGVWRELSSHNSNGGFLRPAIGTDQNAAMLELFDTAVMCRKLPGATTTRRQAELGRDRWLAKAGELRDDARIIGGVAARYGSWSVFGSWRLQPKSARTTPARSTRPALGRWRLSASMTDARAGSP